MSDTPPMMPEKTALAHGFRPLTHPFKDAERWMYRNALLDLKGCNIVVVKTPSGIQIWRDGREIKETRES